MRSMGSALSADTEAFDTPERIIARIAGGSGWQAQSETGAEGDALMCVAPATRVSPPQRVL
jgi:hypothetical protein